MHDKTSDKTVAKKPPTPSEPPRHDPRQAAAAEAFLEMQRRAMGFT